MRIVIDMQGAQTESRFRGIGRYTLSFAQAVVRNRGEHEVFLALSGLYSQTIEPIRAAFEGLLPQENIRVWHAPGPVAERTPGNESRREIAELLREAFLASLQPDVIHLTSLFEGYVDDAVTSIGRFDTRTPVSVVLYDLIPLLNPDQYLTPNPSYEQYYRRKLSHLLQAAKLFAISESTRQEGLSTLGVDENVIVNVSTAIERQFSPIAIDDHAAKQIFAKFSLSRPFVLYTGGADDRKNLPRLIQAYAELPPELRRSHQLVFAGKIPEGDAIRFNYIAQTAGLKPDELHFTGYVSDEELVQLYNMCALYAFPSWHEGFGLPVLEAMACGAPVIGANTSSLPEVIGLDEALFDPLDVSAITQKIVQALTDDTFRTRLRDHGLQQSKRFSWDDTARRAIEAWDAIRDTEIRYSSSQQLSGCKPRLAFVSPLPPERTGIADYSAELLPALAEYYDIELVVAQEKVDFCWANGNSNVRDVAWLRAHAAEIDRVLYQLGNSPFHRHMIPLLEEIPGTVVLHDFYLSGLMSWRELHGGEPHTWTQALYESHGYGAVRDRYLDAEDTKRRYPVNWPILIHAQGVVIHSKYSMDLGRHWYGRDASADWVVIPHLRSPAEAFEKQAARKKIGFDSGDFVICSFGFLDGSKLNHRLLNAWLESAQAQDKRCRLVFVGENHGGEYGACLLKTIRDSGLGDRIRITGFASPELFRHYLAAADLAVQLRTNSRGETSGTVLDCMNHGLPLIVNANGSMSELEPQAVWMLPDDFDDGELSEALQILWRDPERRRTLSERAKKLIRERHAPEECAKRYVAAIERFHHRGQTALPGLVDAIASQEGFQPEDGALKQLSEAMATSFPLSRPARRLFLDVTATCRHDLKTGIERVVRALMMAMLDSPPPGWRIEAVYLTDASGAWHHRHARKYTLGLLDCPCDAMADALIAPQSGDVMLSLDISGEALIQAERSGLYQHYRNIGVTVYAIVYDLLPIRMPEVFPPDADENHAKWLHAVSKFDGAICISRAVAEDLTAWQSEAAICRQERRPYQIGWWHLGADVANSAPSKGLPDNAEQVLAHLASRPSFLMVGTIEPRKGYLQTLDAFRSLWSKGLDINLVIVGKEGWKGLPDAMRRDIPETIARLRTHAERGQRLFWLEGGSDEYLEKVYAASTCLIAASYGEGFGLPLIEAAQHKLPIIARDIPVFREVAGEHAYYFNGATSEELENEILTWIELSNKSLRPRSESMHYLSWHESAQQLLQQLAERNVMPCLALERSSGTRCKMQQVARVE